jgi:hypothetical protein
VAADMAAVCVVVMMLEWMAKVCSFVISSRKDGIAAAADIVVANTFGVVVMMMQTTASSSGRVVDIETIAAVMVENISVLVIANADLILVLIAIRILDVVRTIAVGRIRDTHAKAAVLEVTLVLVTSLRGGGTERESRRTYVR